MTNSIIRSLIALCLTCLLLPGAPVNAQSSADGDASGSVICHILQYSHGRLYLPVGEDQHVYKDAFVDLWVDTTRIGWTAIEHSWIGISVTYPLEGSSRVGAPMDLPNIASAVNRSQLAAITAHVAHAPVDSTATALIGTDIVGLAGLLRLDNSSRISIREYSYRPGMIEDLNNGTLDGCLSFEELPALESGYAAQTLAPFMAALIPNVGRDCNRGGRLTTSLYYRYDEAKLGLMFNGDFLHPQNRFNVFSDTHHANQPHRWYPFDPQRGRELVALASYHPDRVRIYYGHDDLERVAFFFADIIARDRTTVELTRNRREADLYIDFIPVSTRLPSQTIYALQHRFVSDSLPGRTANEYIRQIGAYFRFVEKPADESDYYRNLEAAENIVLDNLGAFPLFRPTLYLVTHQHLQGLTFADDSRLDFNRMIRVALPSTVSSTEPGQ